MTRRLGRDLDTHKLATTVQRFLIIAGIILLVAGIGWPWIQKLGLGHLPGDIVIERENFRFYFPVTTTILISVVLTVVLWLFRR